MAKVSKKIENRARLLKVADVDGWILICRDDDSEEWHIGWLDPFSTKKRALTFANSNSWQKPYQAVRGRITVRQ